MATLAPICDFGWKAPDFRLRATDGKVCSLADVGGPKGTLVAFICNHCPYVKAQLHEIIREAEELKKIGVNLIAISSNDANDYPEDSFVNMQKLARDKRFSFPYLYDETQEVAKAYGAVCTPDFFGYDAQLRLQYRGRINDGGMQPGPHVKRELFEAMQEVAQSGKTSRTQKPSMGCSIKWKARAA